jgi:hypothetical protein
VQVGADGLTPVLLLTVAAVAGIIAGWLWMRAEDELSGRPYWILGLAALAISGSIASNAQASVGWIMCMLLAGAALFLRTSDGGQLDQAVVIGVWGLSALPFSIASSAWEHLPTVVLVALPALLGTQGLLAAGYVRHALRHRARTRQSQAPAWTRTARLASQAILLVTLVLLGVWGWQGALRIGGWPLSLSSVPVFGLMLWIWRRHSGTGPQGSRWMEGAARRLRPVSLGLAVLQRWAAGATAAVSATLEGVGGVMWSLLFLVLVVSLLTGSAP